MTTPPRTPSGAGAELLDHAVDLLVGSSCLGCSRRGRLVCADCLADLFATRPVVARPTPCPPGLAPAWAAGEYDGLLRRMVIDHKEEARFGLGRPLGLLLGAAVAAACASSPRRPGSPGARLGRDGPGPVVLVPVPSRPGVVRARGDDPTRRLVTVAARGLTRSGVPARVLRLLRSHPGVRDQGGLDAASRATNLAGSLWVPSGALRAAARAVGPRPGALVLCDDVLTTGATVREGQRALASVGLRVSAIAVVGAVRKRSEPPGPAIPGVC